jgi:HELP motif
LEAVDEDPDASKGFDVFQLESGGGGDEFMAVKPWLGAIVAPTAPPPAITTKPKVRLDLEWVYGYRGFDARDNVRYNDADGIVYHSAGVGIVYDRSKHAQKFYLCVTVAVCCCSVFHVFANAGVCVCAVDTMMTLFHWRWIPAETLWRQGSWVRSLESTFGTQNLARDCACSHWCTVAPSRASRSPPMANSSCLWVTMTITPWRCILQ